MIKNTRFRHAAIEKSHRVYLTCFLWPFRRHAQRSALVRAAFPIEERDHLFRSGPGPRPPCAGEPLLQLPTLVLPDGAASTKSASDHLYLAERWCRRRTRSRAVSLSALSEIPLHLRRRADALCAALRAGEFAYNVGRYRERLWPIVDERLARDGFSADGCLH